MKVGTLATLVQSAIVHSTSSLRSATCGEAPELVPVHGVHLSTYLVDSFSGKVQRI